MQPILDKGRLITWKDDRGFGFIDSNNGGKDVFLPVPVNLVIAGTAQQDIRTL